MGISLELLAQNPSLHSHSSILSYCRDIALQHGDPVATPWKRTRSLDRYLIQNAAARLVCHPSSPTLTSLLHSLQWLPLATGIWLKSLVLSYCAAKDSGHGLECGDDCYWWFAEGLLVCDKLGIHEKMRLNDRRVAT
ncbi:unnamed protein product [Boreogadus saida]